MRCRKKPIICEYCPVSLIMTGKCAFPSWVMNGFETGHLWYSQAGPMRLMVKTLEGALSAPDDGYLILGVKGEIWPIQADVFAKTYDTVD